MKKSSSQRPQGHVQGHPTVQGTVLAHLLCHNNTYTVDFKELELFSPVLEATRSSLRCYWAGFFSEALILYCRRFPPPHALPSATYVSFSLYAHTYSCSLLPFACFWRSYYIFKDDLDCPLLCMDAGIAGLHCLASLLLSLGLSFLWTSM